MKKISLLFLVLLAAQIPGLLKVDNTIATGDYGRFVYGVGTHFEITDSPYLNISLTSTEVVRVLLSSGSKMVSVVIESNCSAISTILTFDGLDANKTHYRFQDGYLIENFTTDPSGKYMYTQDIIEAHHIIIQQEESTVYIRPDGTISPSTAPINVVNSVYTFTDNIYETIIVQKDNIIIDGNDYTLQGSGGYYGLYLNGRHNVTVRNVVATGWIHAIWAYNSHALEIRDNVVSDNRDIGILLYYNSHSNNITDNTVTRNDVGISLLWGCYFNTITGNNVYDQTTVGVYLYIGCSENQFHHNNFKYNPNQVWAIWNCYDNVWDDGYPSGGNYWKYSGDDFFCGPNQDKPGSDGVCDKPHWIWFPSLPDKDNYPLMNPWTPQSSEADVTVQRAGQTYPIQMISNSMISDVKTTPNKLDFTVTGEKGTSGYIRAMLPVGINTTEIKVFLNNTKLTPPPYPKIVTNNTHYFIYFAFNYQSAYDVTIFFAPIVATIDIDPDALNLRSFMSEWITCYLELPEDYDVVDMSRTTILLNDTLIVDSKWVDKPLESVIGDYDYDNNPDLMVKFDRFAVEEFIIYNTFWDSSHGYMYAYVTLTVTGELNNGVPFKGSDTIKAIIPLRGRLIPL